VRRTREEDGRIKVTKEGSRAVSFVHAAALSLHLPSSPSMKFAVLVSAFLLPVVSLAHDPSPLLAVDGRDLSFFLKRYDGPVAILRRAVKGKRHIVPRTLQVAQVPVRRALNSLAERQQCIDPGYVPCASGTQCCPAGAVCGPGTCCPAGNLVCAGNCERPLSRFFALRSLPLTLSFFKAAQMPWEIAARTSGAAQLVR
jgi:hypothetical protein